MKNPARLALAIAAALATLSAGLAGAVAAQPMGHPVVHRLSLACPPYHRARVRRLRHAVRYRRVEAVVEQPVRYERAEQVSVRETYRYTRIDDASDYDWRTAAEAHLSATDRYGYLTWPGKFPRAYAPPVYVQGCDTTCGMALAPRGYGEGGAVGGYPYRPDRYSGRDDPR